MHPNTPNLLIIGAAKSGTTTLYSILARHPQVFMTRLKATRFFIKTEDYSKGLNWYLQTYFAGAEHYPIRGEATPSYLAQAQITAHRIRETIPGEDTRFIAIFRNPVDRAYSHYWYNRDTKKRHEDIFSFEKELDMEEQFDAQIPGLSEKYSGTSAYYKNGQYSLCLKEYFKYFKRDQFLFLLFEDLFKEQFQNTTTRLTDFLGIERSDTGYIRENPSRRVRSRPTFKFVRKQRGLMSLLKSFLPGSIQEILRNQHARMISKPVQYQPMNPKTRLVFLEKYKPQIIELETMIGRDLSHWLNAK